MRGDGCVTLEGGLSLYIYTYIYQIIVFYLWTPYHFTCQLYLNEAEKINLQQLQVNKILVSQSHQSHMYFKG